MTKENTPSLSKASEILTSNKITIINEYIELVETKLMSEQMKIDDIVMKIDSSTFSDKDDFNDYIDFLIDQNDTLDNIKTLSFQLSIVSLYRIVELGIKKQSLHLFNKKGAEQFFRWKVFKKKYLEKYSIDINNIKYYNEINELRVLNNAIKHEGIVSTELAHFNGWIEGEELPLLKIKFEEYKTKVPIFMSSLMEKIIKAKK